MKSKKNPLALRQALKSGFLLPIVNIRRCRRSEFAWSMLIFALIAAVWFLPQYFLTKGELTNFQVLFVIDGCFASWFLWCVGLQYIRRILDISRRFHIFMGFVLELTIILAVVFHVCKLHATAHWICAFGVLAITLCCLFIDSEKGANSYGASPK